MTSLRMVWSAGLLVALTCCAASSEPGAVPHALQHESPRGESMEDIDSAALADEVLEIVREQFLDPERGAAWASRHVDYGRDLSSRAAFVERTRELLDELGTSHTACYTERDPEHAGLLAIFGEGLGLEVEPVEHIGADAGRDGIMRAVFAGGPAASAGLARGDRIVAAEGAAWEPVASLRGRAGAPVSLVVERAGGERFVVEVIPRRELLADVWRAAIVDGARVIEHGGRRLGYVPVFSCAGQEPLDAVADAISGPLRDCEALVLDLRGGWGGCSPDFVGLFDQAIPVLEFVARDGTRTRLDDRWRGPLVLLIDGGSRSGKELVAHAVKRNQLGLLVGQGTAGAVVGGSLFPLSDGSLLYLAVVDVYVDGVRLEGVGVAPDVSVADAPPGAGGWDPQLDEALERAARLAHEAERQRELEAESNP